MSPEARRLIRTGAVKKGDPLQAARIAGIMAAKETSTLIPLCHPLPLSHVDVELTPTEFSILEMLMRHNGLVVTRKMLCESLWESDWEGTTNVIEVHINRLRNKLQKGIKEPLIHTVRGRGYALRAN